jgi:RNA polymerase sigma-70 factor (family 1)
VPESPDHITPESENERTKPASSPASANAASSSAAARSSAASRTSAASRASSVEADRILFEKIAASDDQAFERIFDKYTAILFPYLLDLVKVEADAKEIIQEVFLKVWLKRDTLPTVENPGGWLYTVAANEALLHFRKEARYTRRLQKVAAGLTASSGDSEANLADIHEQFDTREVKTLIADAVKQLPIRRRQVFQMSRLEGYSRKEIAETLGISENTVRNQLADAVEFIQDYIIKNKSLYLPALLIGLISRL